MGCRNHRFQLVQDFATIHSMVFFSYMGFKHEKWWSNMALYLHLTIQHDDDIMFYS